MRMTLAEREARTRAFMWAWEKMEGWGHGQGKDFKALGVEARMKQARYLAANALWAPVFGDVPTDTFKVGRKRWPAIEEAERG